MAAIAKAASYTMHTSARALSQVTLGNSHVQLELGEDLSAFTEPVYRSGR